MSSSRFALALPDRIERHARTVAESDAEMAAAFRKLAEHERQPERERFLKSTLRQAARISFGLTRTAQAALLAEAWARVAIDEDYEVGSVPELLQRLTRAGFRPLAKRTIIDLLNPHFD